MSDEQLDVHQAYALETTEDRKRLYAKWAATYDDNFAAAVDYIFPQELAQVFQTKNGLGPVLDAGAGTGLVAQALGRATDLIIDAFDISAEMLAVAARKNLYRALVEGDLTKRLPFRTGTYSAVVSAGTFTHGHVGPEALDELMRVADQDALFVLTIKADHYETHGFGAKFSSFGNAIQEFEIEEVPIYGVKSDEAIASDQGLIASFRKS